MHKHFFSPNMNTNIFVFSPRIFGYPGKQYATFQFGICKYPIAHNMKLETWWMWLLPTKNLLMLRFRKVHVVDKRFVTPDSLAFHIIAKIFGKGLESACSGSYLLSSLLCLWQCFCFVLSSLTNHKLSLWRKKSVLPWQKRYLDILIGNCRWLIYFRTGWKTWA